MKGRDESFASSSAPTIRASGLGVLILVNTCSLREISFGTLGPSTPKNSFLPAADFQKSLQ